MEDGPGTRDHMTMEGGWAVDLWVDEGYYE